MDSIYPFLTRRRFLSNSLYHSPSFSFFLSPFAFQLTDHSFLVVLFLFQTTRHCSSKRESLQCRFVTRSCASARTNTSLFIFYLSRTMVLLRLSPLDSHDLRLPLSRSSSSSSFYLFLPLFPFFFLSFFLSFSPSFSLTLAISLRASSPRLRVRSSKILGPLPLLYPPTGRFYRPITATPFFSYPRFIRRGTRDFFDERTSFSSALE